MKILVSLLALFMFSLTLHTGKAQLQYPRPRAPIINSNDAYNNMPRDCNGATFVNTDGIQKLCRNHGDCYDMREPVYWCRLAQNQRWTDKGCFCDSVLKACVIERVTSLGPTSQLLNYAYCTPKATWYCPA